MTDCILIEVDDVKVLLPNLCLVLLHKLDVLGTCCFGDVRFKNDVVVFGFRYIEKQNFFRWVERVFYLFFILRFADFTVESFPRVCNHLIISVASDHFLAWKPCLQTDIMDHTQWTSAFTGAKERIILRLFILKTKPTLLYVIAVSFWPDAFSWFFGWAVSTKRSLIFLKAFVFSDKKVSVEGMLGNIAWSLVAKMQSLDLNLIC